MKFPVPLRENLPVNADQMAIWTSPWASWFNAVMRSLLGWDASVTATTGYDFGSINGGTEESITVSVPGVVSTDTPTVIVTPSSNVSGVNFSGLVTSDDTVTIYAKNFTTGPINPPSMTFRVLVFQ